MTDKDCGDGWRSGSFATLISVCVAVDVSILRSWQRTKHSQKCRVNECIYCVDRLSALTSTGSTARQSLLCLLCFQTCRFGNKWLFRMVNAWEESPLLWYHRAQRGPSETLHQPLRDPRKTLTSLSRRRLSCLLLENTRVFAL